MQEVIFGFDDSGVLHKNSKFPYFAYGGLCFYSKNECNKFKRIYKEAVNGIKKTLNESKEIKSYGLSNKHKNNLFRLTKNFHTLSLIVEIDKLYDDILNNKKSIHRYKDYIIKLIIKKSIIQGIQEGYIDINKETTIWVYMDEQPTSTNGYYSLQESIYEEFHHGICNFNYSNRRPPILPNDLTVNILYCDSKNNYLVQASDIIANRIWKSYAKNKPELRNNLKKHIHKTFP